MAELFARIPRTVLADRKVFATTLRVFVEVAGLHLGPDGCYARVETLARNLHLSVSTVRRHINKLVELGHLKQVDDYRDGSHLFIADVNNWVRMPVWLVRNQFSATALRATCAVASFAGEDMRGCWHSLEDLAAVSGVSERQISQDLAEATTAGLIGTRRRGADTAQRWPIWLLETFDDIQNPNPPDNDPQYLHPQPAVSENRTTPYRSIHEHHSTHSPSTSPAEVSVLVGRMPSLRRSRGSSSPEEDDLIINEEICWAHSSYEEIETIWPWMADRLEAVLLENGAKRVEAKIASAIASSLLAAGADTTGDVDYGYKTWPSIADDFFGRLTSVTDRGAATETFTHADWGIPDPHVNREPVRSIAGMAISVAAYLAYRYGDEVSHQTAMDIYRDTTSRVWDRINGTNTNTKTEPPF